MPKKTDAQHVKDLNRLSPAAADADLGQVLADLIAAHNDLRAKYVALLAKLDADAGVTDTNYAATISPAVAAVGSLSSRS